MEPILRKEMFMAKAAGQNVSVPEPITREEKYLAAIAASGGGGGGDMLVTITVIMPAEEEAQPEFLADKTFAQIESAVNAGKNVRVKIPLPGPGYNVDSYIPLVNHIPGNSLGFVSNEAGVLIIIYPDSIQVELTN